MAAAMSQAMLPPNATPAELAVDAAVAARLDAIGVPLRTLWNPDTCPVALLPWLAWALSVEPWDNDWPEATRRSVIKAARQTHAIKGTPAAVRAVLTAAGYPNATIIERLHRMRCDGANQPNGIFYCGDPDAWALYRVQLPDPITNPQADLVRAMLDESDRGVSRLDGLDFTAALFACNGEVPCDGTYNAGVA